MSSELLTFEESEMKIHFSLRDDQGPISRKPRKHFGPGKLQQNLQPYDYKAVLFTYS